MVTAAIPIFLMWNIRMKRHTKLILHALFAGGVITAAMSIGRAATTTTKALTEDTTCKVPSLPFHR